jgi:hypothetical protein
LKVSASVAKELALQKRAEGLGVKEAMAAVGRSYETWRDWRKTDPVFKAKADKIGQALARGEVAKSEVPDFPDFCEQYLGMSLGLHHLRIWDVIQGREPRDLRESMQWQRGAWPGRYTMINIPPDHAKSTTWTVMYTVWEIARNPDIRIGIVSKSQTMAKKFLGQIKFYLQNAALFPELHAAFAPEGGWRSEDKGDGLSWRENMIYIKGRTESEKEPTVEALGIGSHLYGTRFDRIILDDVEDMASAGQFDAHADWVGQEVFNRLHPEHGQLLVLGTRVGVMDLYRKLRDEAKTEDGDPFYTYFAQPAILENETGHSSEWEVLWPERLDAKKIARAKAAMTDPRRFTFVYQQRDVSEHATFPPEAVDASINRMRQHGPMSAGAPTHRPQGMQGLYVVGAWDPASSAGHNAFIVAGTDKVSKKRWVLDVWDKKGVGPRQTIPLLKELTLKYHINEWRIEKNAVQQFITQLPEIRDFLSGNGCRLVEHQTTGNKWDPNMGVEGTLVSLFMSGTEDINGRLIRRTDGGGLIEMPSPRTCKDVDKLAEQLKQWEPGNKKLVQDLVMALWFAELGMRQYLRSGLGNQTHAQSRFTSRAAVARRGVFRFDSAGAA